LSAPLRSASSLRLTTVIAQTQPVVPATGSWSHPREHRTVPRPIMPVTRTESHRASELRGIPADGREPSAAMHGRTRCGCIIPMARRGSTAQSWSTSKHHDPARAATVPPNHRQRAKTHAGQRALPVLDLAREAFKRQADRQARYQSAMGPHGRTPGLCSPPEPDVRLSLATSNDRSAASATATRSAASRCTASGTQSGHCSKGAELHRMHHSLEDVRRHSKGSGRLLDGVQMH